MSEYTSGDAKWFFDDVSVQSNGVYTFSNSYNSNVPTSVVARFIKGDGSEQYATIAQLPSSDNTWKTVSASFQAPIGALS